jgi:hypothetical protein
VTVTVTVTMVTHIPAALLALKQLPQPHWTRNGLQAVAPHLSLLSNAAHAPECITQNRAQECLVERYSLCFGVRSDIHSFVIQKKVLQCSLPIPGIENARAQTFIRTSAHVLICTSIHL